MKGRRGKEMVAVNLADLLRGAMDACEVCHNVPFTRVVTMTFKGKVHHKNPDCTCNFQPLKAHMCADCAERAVKCSRAECDEGKDCDVLSVTVQTDVEAIDEYLSVKAVEQGTTPEALRFGMAYRMDAREASTVLEALQAAGISVDFLEMRPTIGTRTTTIKGNPGTSGDTKSSDELAGESGKRPKDGGSPKPAAWPKPIFSLPHDGQVH